MSTLEQLNGWIPFLFGSWGYPTILIQFIQSLHFFHSFCCVTTVNMSMTQMTRFQVRKCIFAWKIKTSNWLSLIYIMEPLAFWSSFILLFSCCEMHNLSIRTIVTITNLMSLFIKWYYIVVNCYDAFNFQLSEEPDWMFMRGRHNQISLLFGIDDHWGPLSHSEEVNVHYLPLIIA